jgi:DNA repair exonuclease SbcCD nuclease subunit
MRFIHTADWQLGCKYSSTLRSADGLRSARLDAVKQIIAVAEKQGVDFIVAAGDLLEHNLVDNGTIEQMAHIVSSSAVPVYLLPGNHDPLMPDSPYERKPDLFKNNAHILSEQKPVSVKGGTLYPCPLKKKASREDPTLWIPPRDSKDGIRIGIAHGSAGYSNPDDFPIDPKAAHNLQLDYLALGHWHGTKKIDDRTWYCGTPEPTNFGENPGNVLLVEVEKVSSTPAVKQLSVATHIWHTITMTLHGSVDFEILKNKISEFRNPNTLIKVKLDGTLPQSDLMMLESLTGDGFCEFRLEANVAVARENVQYHHPLLNEMVRYIQEKSAEEPSQAEEIRRALSQLNKFISEANFQKDGR